jgi:predicted metal-dependent hydrolase
MKKRIELKHGTVEFTIVKHPRAKSIRVTIRKDGTMLVTSPRYIPYFIIKQYLQTQSTWIIQTLTKVKNNPPKISHKESLELFKQYKDEALHLIEKRLEVYAGIYPYTYTKVRVKNQKTRWGSCSKAGNLAFNYKIMFLPTHLMDYVIVHELCHLEEFNHGPLFWKLVAQTIPNHLEYRRELQEHGIALG